MRVPRVKHNWHLLAMPRKELEETAMMMGNWDDNSMPPFAARRCYKNKRKDNVLVKSEKESVRKTAFSAGYPRGYYP
jgi:hypothetical protein